MPAPPQLEALVARLQGTDGPDATLDQVLGRVLEGLGPETSVPAYTASVDRCLELLHRLFPRCHWHIGYSVTGLLPYAVISLSPGRFEATAPTVPLALLIAITDAQLALRTRETPGN